MQRDHADVIALDALGWMAEAELLDQFQSTTGADRDAIVAGARDPAFLGAVLDFVMLDDDWVTGFCRARGYSTDTFAAARAALPGGDLPHWT
ncbi:DUF3572 domain-containing protein [uncultured Jannaschia sp.]|uniref:DUF3572 domain-containing protein n=1 Tax=uncultured Jannaschia sp. TaxID=293347 RepID=UPI0026381AD1|nr:DUF3572 domain-containing protein [uncultured Jannaschia sp.]